METIPRHYAKRDVALIAKLFEFNESLSEIHWSAPIYHGP